jgi:hypothetical protein
MTVRDFRTSFSGSTSPAPQQPVPVGGVELLVRGDYPDIIGAGDRTVRGVHQRSIVPIGISAVKREHIVRFPGDERVLTPTRMWACIPRSGHWITLQHLPTAFP